MAVSLVTSAYQPRDPAPNIEHVRTTYGRAARPWAGGGRYVASDDHWIATSEYRQGPNQALVHAPSGTVLDEVRETLVSDGMPSVLFVAGAALGNVQRLTDAGWVCVGQQPFMARPVDVRDRGEVDRHPSVTQLSVAGSDALQVHAILADAFDLDLADAPALLPNTFFDGPDQQLWVARDIAGSLVACAMTSRADDIVGIWNVATRSNARRAGHGERLMRVIHGHLAASEGVKLSLLCASPSGYPLYARLGYNTLEHWQMWSRPRWFLGRT